MKSGHQSRPSEGPNIELSGRDFKLTVMNILKGLEKGRKYILTYGKFC